MKTPEILYRASRQYRHNDSNETVAGFDYAETIEIVSALEKAYKLARDSAAGLTNHCEENGSTRRCERELEEADSIYRSIK